MKPLSKPKIIFFDIDDTLYVKYHDTVPDSVFDALHQLKQQGIIPAIATGRGRGIFPKAINELIDKVGIDLIISINGQCSHYQGELLADFPLEKSLIDDMTTRLNAQNLSYGFMTSDKIFALKIDDALHEALSSLHIPYETLSLEEFNRSQAVYQIVAFHQDNAHLDLSLPDGLKSVRWHKKGFDILDINGSKARGIEQALNKLDLTFADAMAFGDGLNDVEMLQAVGFGVAMGNAHPKLKEIADYVCPNAIDNGIYQGLKDLAII